MKRSLAERFPEMHLCPFCDFTSDDWNKIVDHMVEKHKDSEAREHYGIG